jgi:hypothetical protein
MSTSRPLLCLVLMLLGCPDPWKPAALDRVCEDVGFSVAAVAFECTSSELASQAAFDAYQDRYRCRIADIHGEVEPDDSNGRYTWANGVPMEVYYTCPAVVGAIDCATYEAFARKDFAGLDDWLGLAPACATILERADGSRLPVDEP